MTLPTQASNLLAAALEPVELQERVTVLDMGPARPETLAFFSRRPCRLYVADLFSELPLAVGNDTAGRDRLHSLLQLAPDTRLDICLFWDLFNYLSAATIAALLTVLRPHLHADTRAHAFGVHKRLAHVEQLTHGIRNPQTLTVRSRARPLPGYAPLSPARLQDLLTDFRFERSVLLPDGRLELALGVKLENAGAAQTAGRRLGAGQVRPR